MRIDLVSGVFLASTRDRVEGATLKSLGGWRWHSGVCDPRFCKRPCPASGLAGWWTTDAATAARATGAGVHTDASLAAIEIAKVAPRAPKRAASVGFDEGRGIFTIDDADKAEAEAIKSASGGDQRWRWHSGDCNAEFCRKGCPANGRTGWWSTDVALVRPLRLFWADSLRLEMERREDSLALSRATGDAQSSSLPCPAGKAYLPYQAAGIRYAMARRNALIADEMGLGKAQPKSEPVLTPTGWKTMGELEVGDLVVGRNGKPTRVTGVFPQGKKKVFRVKLDDGSSTRCCDEHLWLVQSRNDRHRGSHGRVMDLRKIIDGGLRDTWGAKWFVPLTEPICFTSKSELLLHPYVLGQMLANGNFATNTTPRWSGTSDQADMLVHYLSEIGCGMSPAKGSDHDYNLTFGRGPNLLAKTLRDLGLYGLHSYEKRVPVQYLTASVEDRLMLLRGLMDGDGTVTDDGSTVEYNSTSPELAAAVMELVRSLGGVAWMSTREPRYSYKGEMRTGRTDHRVRISISKEMNPFALKRKSDRFLSRGDKYPACHSIESIVEDGEEDQVCISVAADDRLYITKDYIVTHNTVQAVGVVNADSEARRVLVIAPASLREVWRRHAESWSTRKTRVVVLETGADVTRAVKSNALVQREDETLWVIISYGGCRTASVVGKLLHGSDFAKAIDVLILDECHRTKERDSQQSKGAIALAASAKRVLSLTGTPVLNRPVELATTLSMLDKNFNFWRFAQKYCGGKQTRFGWDFSGSSNEAELQRDLRETFMIRRLKKDVLKELPKKSWSVVALNGDAVPAHLKKSTTTAKAAKIAAMRAIATATGDREAVRASIDAELTAFSAEFDRMAGARVELGSYKVGATAEHVATLPADECVLVFAHHKSVARAIFDRLGGDKAGVYLDGDVDSADRVDLVDQFQASTDAKFRFVVATIESAKEGLTITRASRVVFAEQAWTPGTMAQAEDRAHRIGQTKGVQVDYLVFDGTLDAYLCKLLAEKGRIAQAILDDQPDEADDVQNEVVLREEAPKPTAAFDPHDPDAYVRRVAAAAVRTRETPEQYAQRTAGRRGVATIYQPSETEIAAVLEGMRALSADDPDLAREENGVGFSKSDVYVGHALAQLDTLSPELWALGASLCRKYRGQVGDALVAATGVDRA